MKNLKILVLALIAVPLLSGCLGVLAGAGGTALWQGGKIISEEMVSLEKGTKAVEAAFNNSDIATTNKVARDEVVQIRGEDYAGTKVAVDIFSKGPKNIRIEVRYGLGEEDPARDLLNEIKKRL